MVGFHILTSIVTYINIDDKNKAGILGLFLSVTPVINIIIFMSQIGDKLRIAKEQIISYTNNEDRFNNFVLKLQANEMTEEDIRNQILKDLKKIGALDIVDDEISLALFRYAGAMSTKVMLVSKYNIYMKELAEKNYIDKLGKSLDNTAIQELKACEEAIMSSFAEFVKKSEHSKEF